MKAAEIRRAFLDYFTRQNHTIVPSHSLLPQNDKTLLFVNSGMVPFKNAFAGLEKPRSPRIASCQRCIRAGGKHNDLENVGYTERHHTFFEMLGNFSFGDYFKKDAIRFAWEFLTVELKLPADKLWVSVFEEDDEAEAIWTNEIGFPKSRISRCGAKDNFWQMGDTGPCGPCSEIFYDFGSDIAGGPPGHADEDGERYTEIWNLVFTQFDRKEDGYLKPLKKPCVDTGMGLERLAAVMQNVAGNYDTDCFVPLTKAVIALTPKLRKINTKNHSVRVIADHIRSSAFIIADGVSPANEGRGYVLRRIIRRAIRHAHKLEIDKIFFYRLAAVVARMMKPAYPELTKNLARIENTIRNEEKMFAATLVQGMKILREEIDKTNDTEIAGAVVFKLYDTYGFPVDLTADVARENGLGLDLQGFDIEMSKQRERARKAAGGVMVENIPNINYATEFLGYLQLENQAAVVSLVNDNRTVEKITAGDEAVVVLEKSCFYGESGGQVGDSGMLVAAEKSFAVRDTQKQPGGAFLHYGTVVKGEIKIGDKLVAEVDRARRKSIARNHSATHLLHAALRKIFGEAVMQKGSLVDAEKLRFDFSHESALGNEDLDRLEAMVNRKILGNTEVHTEVMTLDAAKKKGAVALFGEKYDDTVRVLTMGKNNFSVELCGGTHVARLGDIGLFRIISESAVAAGVRRIEAKTGYAAYQHDKSLENQIRTINEMTASAADKTVEKIENLLKTQKILNAQMHALQKKMTAQLVKIFAAEAVEKNGVQIVARMVNDIGAKNLRDLNDGLKDKLEKGIIVVGTIENDKAALVVGVAENLIPKYDADKILKTLARKIDGRGGGRADMAQGGGGDLAKLKKALDSVFDWLFENDA